MAMGASLVLKTVDTVLSGKADTVLQDKMFAKELELKPAPKIFKDTCRIDWGGKTASEIFNFIRGLSPYPRRMDRIKPARQQ